ncbi:two-component sensor histidine kinase [Streptomyces spiroverticillatus]|uniref:histidine kinase n=1 Tax=Streptomyces finlayi TaxID=67296 RepID=A0A919CEN9_9ACTN|nr:two-component sensor histidine kinase [Streptomyces spiroverticillatus]GHD15518.1 two-component sensor histidine kinase [Streptomyces finlayi]
MPSPPEHVFAVLNRDPLLAPHRLRTDTALAAAVGALTAALALLVYDGRAPDVLGWLLLAVAVLALVWRRVRPVPVLLVVLAAVAPYHALDYTHTAPVPVALIAMYTVAATSRPVAALLIGLGAVGLAVSVMLTVNTHQGLELLGTSGWIVAVVLVGVALRLHRRYVAAIVERAERAERTREQEAARRVAEERVRIARDLHDLLAHSITLIGVQTSVAAHVLTVAPDRFDRAALAGALDGITETCRTARGELRTTLEVLRADDPAPDGPLPDLAALPELARRAEATLHLDVDGVQPVPAVQAAAYRIVQEALTNAVRHGGDGAKAAVRVAVEQGSLRVRVTDDGAGSHGPHGIHGSHGPDGTGGYGLTGMRERARSVNGTLAAGPRDGGGFEVSAVLPLGGDKARDDGPRESGRTREGERG